MHHLLYTLNLFSHLFWMTLQKGRVSSFLSLSSWPVWIQGVCQRHSPSFFFGVSLSNSYPSSFLLEIPSHFISVTWQLNGLILINQAIKGMFSIISWFQSYTGNWLLPSLICQAWVCYELQAWGPRGRFVQLRIPSKYFVTEIVMIMIMSHPILTSWVWTLSCPRWRLSWTLMIFSKLEDNWYILAYG